MKSFLFWQVTFLFWLVPVVSHDVPFSGEHSTACLDALAAVLKEILANYSCASQSLLLPPPVSPGLSCALEAPIHHPWCLISPQKALSHAISEWESRKESMGHLLNHGKNETGLLQAQQIQFLCSQYPLLFLIAQSCKM